MQTSAGRDHALACVYGTGTQPAAANYLALTANSTAPALGDTTLTGEITTPGGGLVRAQAVYAHTNGQPTATLTKTFTTNGSDTLPVTVNKIGVFNAGSGGVMTNTSLLNAPVTLSAAGDAVTITDTITAS